MTKLKVFLRRYPVVALALAVLILAGVLNWNGMVTAAHILIGIFAGTFAAYTLVSMVRDMLKGHFGLDILALLAIISTLLVGEYWASIIVVLMLSGGEALEDYAANRAQRELTALLDRTPTTAHLVAASGDENTPDTDVRDIPVENVDVGNVLLVLPAEITPVDCELLSTSGTFDESSITGESLPVTAYRGEEIPSGAVNGAEAVKVRALKKSSDSQYQQIIRLVEESERSKAPVVRLADRFAVPFTIAALLIGGVAWALSGSPVRFVEVLVLATPCPLLIAAPVAFMGGMSRAAKNGIIVKGGATLEQAARVRSAGFDKTGTLTDGEPELVGTVCGPGVSETDLLQVAATAEQYSSHVLAAGILRAAAAAGISPQSATSAREQTAQGVEAEMGGETLRVGRFSYIEEHAPSASRVDLTPGQVAVYVARGSEFLGALLLADQMRPETPAVVSWLRDHRVEKIVMLTGDTKVTAEQIGAAAGITDIEASLRPGDKVAAVRGMEPKPTMMVGDGVNDAPVLAVADVGVAMGARGSTAAGEAADAVILQDSLAPVASLVSISKDTVRIALTAIWLGIILSVALMLIAAITGMIPAVVGALLQEVLDLVAILYALRALRGKVPQFSSPQQKRPAPAETALAH